MQLARAGAKRAVTRHILHLPMPPFGEPFEEARLGRRKIRVRDADRLETEIEAPALDALREPCKVNAHEHRS